MGIVEAGYDLVPEQQCKEPINKCKMFELSKNGFKIIKIITSKILSEKED